MKFLHTRHSFLGLAPAFKHRTHVVVETRNTDKASQVASPRHLPGLGRHWRADPSSQYSFASQHEPFSQCVPGIDIPLLNAVYIQ